MEGHLADSDFKKRYWGRLQQLQKEHLAARKAGDFALAKKKREDIRRIAAVPFDSYIRKVDGIPRANGLGPANPINPESEPEQEPDDIGEGDVDQDQQFGQPIDEANQQQAKTAGQEQADELNKANIEQTTVKPEKEAIPGGPAPKAAGAEQKGPDFKGAEQGQPPKPRTGVGGAIQNAGDKVKEATKVAAEQVKKAVKKAIATAAKQAITAFFASPWGWPITLGCLGLILIAIIIAIFIGMVYGNHSTISTTGSTFVQPTNPLTDKEWIQKLLLMAGDKEIGNKITKTLLQGVEANLTSLESDYPMSDQAKQTLASMRQTITQFYPLIGKTDDASKKQRTDLANKLLDDFKKLDGFLRNNIPVYSGPSAPRLPVGAVANYGGTPHGYSLNYPSNSPARPGKFHNVVVNDFRPSGSYRDCDALDIYPSGSRDVYPIFDGKVTKKRKLGDTSRNIDVVIVEDANGYRALYTDITASVNEGDQVSTSTKLGVVTNGLGLIHIQIAYKNVCAVTTPADNADWIRKGRSGAYGDYLAVHIKTIFNLN